MKRLLKRALSVVLAVVFVVTLIPANAANPSAIQEAEKEVTYNATNILGEVLSQAMESETEENNGYFIQDITVDGLSAEAQISAPDGITLVVAIYDEKSGEMITSGKATVDSATETVKVNLGECDMPEYFVVKAFLLDENNAPVCQNYEGLTYIEAYQEFLSKTTDDFDEEKVINLDSGKESNFAVVSDDTVVIEKSLGENNVVTDDYENGMYAFDNADEELKSLESGDVLYYVYGDGPEDYILTKVGEIEINGDEVTITAADDAEISDLFSYIKIDTSKAVYEEPVMSGAHYDDDSGDMDDSSNEFKVSVTKEFKSSEHVSASFTGEISVKFYLQFYYDYNLFKEDYYELTETTTASFIGTTEIKADVEYPFPLDPVELFKGSIPIFTGLSVEIKLELQIKVAAQVSVSGGIEIKLVGGSRKVSGKPEEDLSKDPSVKLKFSIEGKATFDIIPSFSVGLKILKVFKIAGEVSSDLCISATVVLAEAESGSLFSDDVLHNCALCIDGDVTATFSINIKFEFGINKKKKKTILDLNLFSASTKLGDFYISFIALDDGSLSFADFGFGECPFCEYKVTFNVVDENGKPLEKVKISDDVNTVETDSKGKAYCHYKDGTYTYTITRNGYEIDTLKMNFDELVFVVHGGTVTVNVYMKKSGNTSSVLDSGTCGDNLTWTLYNDGELIISGTGDMYDYFGESPWYKYKSKIESAIIKNSVTSVGQDAFLDCGALTRVTIGSGVTRIGDSAFGDCTKLTIIALPNRVTDIGACAFNNTGYSNNNKNWENDVLYIGNYLIKAKLTINDSYEIKKNTLVIADEAFMNCPPHFVSVTIPDSVVSIGDYAFASCMNLKNITIPDSVIAIGDSAFYNCRSFTNITIPDGVTSIGDSAFYNCVNLSEITIPDTVCKIGSYAFDNTAYYNDIDNWYDSRLAWHMAILYIDNHLVSTIGTSGIGIKGENTIFYPVKEGTIVIADGTFNDSEITSIDIPESVKYIGNGILVNCPLLENIQVNENNKYYSVNNNVLFNKKQTELIKYPAGKTSEKYVIPNSVTCISSDAFAYCSNLKNIKIPDTVLSIGDGAFSCCYNLTNINIPDGVTNIGSFAFCKCYSLTNITIPGYVTRIGYSAFQYCDGLTIITIPDSLTRIESFAFEGCNSLANVYYTGTKKQWSKILIDSSNEDLKSANITYNYVIPETVSLNSSSNAVVLSGNSDSAKTVYNAQNGYFYTLMAVKDKYASDLLSNENLLFIDQKTADSSTLTFDVFVPESVTDYEIIITTNALDEPDDEPPVVPSKPSTEPTTEPSTKPVEVPTTTKPAETEPSTKPVEVPSTTRQPSTKPVETPTTKPTEPSTKPSVPSTEPITKPVMSPVTEMKATVEIRKPSQTEIKYGDSIVLHAEVENLPEGVKIEWSADNGNFTIVEVSADGMTCRVTPASNGDTVFTAKVVDTNGNEVVKDEQTMTSKAGFFRKIIAFFKKLFGLTEVIPEVFKGII